MDDGVEFNEAAFRHNISEEDIRWAATRPLYEDLLEGFYNKYLVPGYDKKHRLLEIIDLFNNPNPLPTEGWQGSVK
jgi:hypothetical protein